MVGEDDEASEEPLTHDDEPLNPADARRLILSIINGEAGGTLLPSDHGVEEMEADDLDMGDALNILRGGAVQPAEWEGGEWRYRVVTARMGCAVAFELDMPKLPNLVLVTAWRNE